VQVDCILLNKGHWRRLLLVLVILVLLVLVLLRQGSRGLLHLPR
jgi:hypothetical protein